jgi:hypothetical protein
MRVRTCLIQSLCFLTLTLVLGCSKGSSGAYGTAAGTVTLNSVAVDGARVEFHSTTETGDGKRDVFVTTTDSNGKYMLAAVGKNPGIPPGMYKVVITKTNQKDPNPNQGKEGFDQGQIDAASAAGGSTGFVNFLPKEYASVATTKLSATIQEGKNENVNFDLKGK